MKNKILKFITLVNGLCFLIGACSLDTEGTNIPFWMCVIPMFWFFPFLYANNWFEKEGD